MVPNAFSVLAAAAVAIVSVAGCSSTTPTSPATTTADDTTTLVQDGSDASATENDAETMATSFISGSGSLGLQSAGDLVAGDLKLENIGDGVKSYYVPSACLVVATDLATATATYTFNDCTGPFGLLHLSGTVAVTYQTSAGTLVLNFVGTGLSVNKATDVDFTAHAVVTAKAAGAREMTWSAELTGTTARGKSFTRTNQKTIDWTVGGSCVTVAGSSDGDVAKREIHTDVIAYSRCKGECPAAGSEIKITDSASKESVDITYDGDRAATFTEPNGTTIQVVLACGL